MKGDGKMDKQINALLNTKDQESNRDLRCDAPGSPVEKIPVRTSAILPVNTRTIGAPEGIYILYLEDYVHTFMKKILSDKKTQSALSGDVLEGIQPDIALFGRCVEENGRYRIVVSGAAVLQESGNKVKQYNDTYFPSCTYIGSACVSLNKDSRLRLELTLHNTKVILDDFYIYYDQNEEMQNYLVEWNKTPLSPTEHETYIRKNVDDAARLGRIAQAYNRGEAKVSFMWNIMNVLCLGFVVCVMVYGIIFINNYGKMQKMQANIDYCMTFIVENTSFDIPKAKTDEDNAVSTMQQNMQSENEKAGGVKADAESAQITPETQEINLEEQANTTADEKQPVTEVQTETDVNEEAGQQEADQPAEDTAKESVETSQQPTGDQASSIPQYYVVQRGDTLRTICFDIYGDYSRVEEICRQNNIEDPDNILYGQKLLLP